MANQDGPFRFVDDDGEDDGEVVFAGSLEELEDSLADLPPAVMEALQGLLQQRVDAMPDNVFVDTAISAVNNKAKMFSAFICGVSGDTRLMALLDDEQRAALVSIAEAAEAATLLLQEALVAKTANSDERMEEVMGPAISKLNQHIIALEERDGIVRPEEDGGR